MPTEQEIQQSIERQWKKRAKCARKRLAYLETWAARERYEREFVQRLLEKASSEETREAWQVQVEVLEMMIGEAEEEIEVRQSELALCEAMLTEIRADMGEEA